MKGELLQYTSLAKINNMFTSLAAFTLHNLLASFREFHFIVEIYELE